MQRISLSLWACLGSVCLDARKEAVGKRAPSAHCAACPRSYGLIEHNAAAYYASALRAYSHVHDGPLPPLEHPGDLAEIIGGRIASTTPP